MMTKNLALAASIAMLAAISGLASARAGRIVHPGFARSDRPLGPASATCLQCFLFGDGVGRPRTRTGQNQHQSEERWQPQSFGTSAGGGGGGDGQGNPGDQGAGSGPPANRVLAGSRRSFLGWSDDVGALPSEK
jgi:hypothetical protein